MHEMATTCFFKSRRYCNLLLGLSIVLSVLLAVAACILFMFDPFDEEALSYLGIAFSLPFVSFFWQRYRIAKERLMFVAITADQYPEVFAVVNQLATAANLPYTPPVYLAKDPSVDPCTLNPGLRNAVLLGTDFLAGSRENHTPEGLRFMLAHQIGHFAAGHHRPIWIMGSAAAMGIPGLKTLVTRGLEFTADLFAAAHAPEGAVDALALCAVGKDNYPYVDPTVQTNIARKHLGLMGMIARWSADEVSPTERMVKLQRSGLLVDPTSRAIPTHQDLLPQHIVNRDAQEPLP